MSDFPSSPDADYPCKKSRTEGADDVSPPSPTINPPPSNSDNNINVGKAQADKLASMADMVQSSDRSSWLKATKWFHELLLHGSSPPIKEVILSRVIHKFVLFLTMDEEFPELQELAAHILIYIGSETSTSMDTEVTDPRQRALVLLLQSDDEEVLRHTCASLGVISGGMRVNLKKLIIEANLYARIRQLVNHESPTVVIGAVRVLGNLVKENEEMSKLMLSDGGFEELRRFLQHKNVWIQKEACWATSSLCAGAGWVIEEVFNAGLMEHLVNILKNADIGVREVAARAISYATSGATDEQIRDMVLLGAIRALSLQLCCRNKSSLDASLNALEMIMKCGEKLKKDEDGFNPYAVDMYECGGWGLLSDYYASYDFENYRKALLFQKRYSVSPED